MLRLDYAKRRLVQKLMGQLDRRTSARYLLAGKYRRIYQYHIRKTAGTSLSSAFWGLAGENRTSLDKRMSKSGTRRAKCKGLIFVRGDRRLIEEGNYFYANSHIPAYQLILPEDTFTITVLRDPLKRIISHYRYLRALAETGQEALTFSEERDYLGANFNDFLDNIPKQHLLRQLYMFSESYDEDEALERISRCSAVLFTETFSSDLMSLGRQLDLPLQEKKDRQFDYATSISPSSVNRAKKLLEQEYHFIEKIRQQNR
jgi:hypothetical protein